MKGRQPEKGFSGCLRRHSVMRRDFFLRGEGFAGILRLLLTLVEQPELRLLQIKGLAQIGNGVVQAGQQFVLQGETDFQLGNTLFQLFHYSTMAAIQPAINSGML